MFVRRVTTNTSYRSRDFHFLPPRRGKIKMGVPVEDKITPSFSLLVKGKDGSIWM